MMNRKRYQLVSFIPRVGVVIPSQHENYFVDLMMSNWIHFTTYGKPIKMPETLLHVWDDYFDNISRYCLFFSGVIISVIEIGRRINLTYLLTADIAINVHFNFK